MAEACRNRTNPSTLPRRNNGFEDRGSHQTPFASVWEERRTITLRSSRTIHERMSLLLPIYAFAIGAIVGSFLNVVIHRYPREESIVFPPSKCPQCSTAIKPYDNIPIVSYAILRGRCRACRAPIAVRYPMLELANGILWTLVYLRAREGAELFGGLFFTSACLALAAIDAEFQILPDKITLTGIAAGILVLADLSYPGWTASVDGHPAPILAADGYLRAVALSPGAHRVEFRYRPVSFSAGAALSLLALAALAVLLLRGPGPARGRAA